MKCKTWKYLFSGLVALVLVLTLTAPALAFSSGITPTSLPNGEVGVAYSQTLSISGGSGSYTWSISAGALPAGLSLSATGTISGTPTAAGVAKFTVKVNDGISTATQALTILINPALTITTTSLPNGEVNVVYTPQTLKASGGSGSYTWSISAGALPAGLLLSATGTISGTPTATAPSFTVKVSDGISTATKALTITIDPALH
jgi:hypothetical protein